ncbi:MAG: GIY-YIG nuclease family protein [Porticoccaceae bacterium]|nr:GIY-YIG nuclease family protein [Porticoccaceae bacterium]
MLEASDSSLYTGITTDVDRRLRQHQSGRGGAKYFRGRSALAMVFVEGEHTRSSASRREAQLKKFTRHQKLALISL